MSSTSLNDPIGIKEKLDDAKKESPPTSPPKKEGRLKKWQNIPIYRDPVYWIALSVIIGIALYYQFYVPRVYYRVQFNDGYNVSESATFLNVTVNYTLNTKAGYCIAEIHKYNFYLNNLIALKPNASIEKLLNITAPFSFCREG